MRRVGGRSRRLVLPAFAAGFFLAFAGGPLPPSGPAAAQPASTAHVSMKEFAFMPASITVKAGTTVTWTYDESVTDPIPNCETVVLSTQCPGHTATATDKGPDGKPLFNSGNLKGAGASYSVTLTKPGTYAYYCIYHGGTMATGKNNPVTSMNGSIVVQAAGRAAPTPAPPSTTPARAATVQGASAARRELSNTGGPALFGWALLPLAGALWLRRRPGS